MKCPQCGQQTVYKQENKFRPFCSERCKLIDLGQWADESYRIPVPGSVQMDIDPNNPSDNNEDSEA